VLLKTGKKFSLIYFVLARKKREKTPNNPCSFVPEREIQKEEWKEKLMSLQRFSPWLV